MRVKKAVSIITSIAIVAKPAKSAKNACRITRPALPFRLVPDLAPFDPLEKGSRQLPFAGMALSVDRAEIEELVAERIPFFVLGKDALQGKSQFAQSSRFRPGAAFALFQQFDVGKQPPPAAGALIQAGHQLLAKNLRQRIQLTGLRFIAWVHDFPQSYY
jgi:hypothetical protein